MREYSTENQSVRYSIAGSTCAVNQSMLCPWVITWQERPPGAGVPKQCCCVLTCRVPSFFMPQKPMRQLRFR